MYSITFQNFTVGSGSVRIPLLNQILMRMRYADLNESIGVNNRNFVNKFCLEIPLAQRIHLKGTKLAVNALLHCFSGEPTKDHTGSFEINRTIFSLPRFVSVAQQSSDCTVAKLITTTLRGAPDYTGNPERDMISILAKSNLVDFCYSPTRSLGFNDLVSLGMAILLYSNSYIAFIDQRQLSINGSTLEGLGREIKIEYCDRVFIMIGEQQPPNWFDPEKEVHVL